MVAYSAVGGEYKEQSTVRFNTNAERYKEHSAPWLYIAPSTDSTSFKLQ